MTTTLIERPTERDAQMLLGYAVLIRSRGEKEMAASLERLAAKILASATE
jgi:hypothetical protein